MKFPGALFAVLFIFQQQSCDQSMMTKGQDGVTEAINTSLLPRVQEYFPNATWHYDGQNPRIIEVDTNVRGVSVEFVKSAAHELVPKLQAEFRNLESDIFGQFRVAFAKSVRAYPEQISFVFNPNTEDCRTQRRIFLDYFTGNGQASYRAFPAEYPGTDCGKPMLSVAAASSPIDSYAEAYAKLTTRYFERRNQQTPGTEPSFIWFAEVIATISSNGQEQIIQAQDTFGIYTEKEFIDIGFAEMQLRNMITEAALRKAFEQAGIKVDSIYLRNEKVEKLLLPEKNNTIADPVLESPRIHLQPR